MSDGAPKLHPIYGVPIKVCPPAYAGVVKGGALLPVGSYDGAVNEQHQKICKARSRAGVEARREKARARKAAL